MKTIAVANQEGGGGDSSRDLEQSLLGCYTIQSESLSLRLDHRSKKSSSPLVGEEGGEGGPNCPSSPPPSPSPIGGGGSYWGNFKYLWLVFSVHTIMDRLVTQRVQKNEGKTQERIFMVKNQG